jgi:hypothetical protein
MLKPLMICILICIGSPGGETVVINDFCELTKEELEDFVLTAQETEALTPENIRKLWSLVQKYDRICGGDEDTLK